MADMVQPPVAGSVLVLTLDTTSREYDLRAVKFANLEPGVAGRTYLLVHAEGADAFLAFSSESGATVSETAAESAGATLTGFTTNGCARIPSGSERDYIIERNEHRYLIVKGSGAGKLRLHASSHPSHG